METLKFKTSIKCSGCVAKLTPVLNETVGEDNWEVNLQSPEKTLTVSSDEAVNPAIVVAAIEGAGYKAESLN